jgi:hypothetical protein
MAGQAAATGGITYPTAGGQSTTSDELNYDNLIVDRSVGGIVRVRSTVPLANIKKVFIVIHSVLTLTEKTALETFYKTYRDSNLDLLWKADNLHYAVRFIDIPKYTMLGGLFWKAEVKLAEI